MTMFTKISSKFSTALLFISAISAVSLAVFSNGCSHGIERVGYPLSTNPTETMEKISADIQDGYTNQLDVLADDDFKKSRAHLDEAREKMKDGEEQKEVLHSLGYSRAYLDRAQKTAAARRENLEGILKSRRAALDAGAAKFPKEGERLQRLDKGLRDMAEKDSSIEPSEFADLQKEYSDLELNATQTAMLGDARAKIQGAKDDDAEKTAPRALQKAEIDLKNAENSIAENRNQRENYADAVSKSKASADKLSAVVAEQLRSNKELSEDNAIKIVEQRTLIDKQKNQLTDLYSENSKLSSDNAAAMRVTRLKKALEDARHQFKPSEAEVYEQGDSLLLRLKSIRFKVGQSTLPATSHDVLSKVSTVATALNPRQIVIEGQTDSIGSKTLNEKLSLQRAEAVATYLETQSGIDKSKLVTKGAGYQRPITANKTKEGRANNRRVDIWIVPEGARDVNFNEGVEGY